MNSNKDDDYNYFILASLLNSIQSNNDYFRSFLFINLMNLN